MSNKELFGLEGRCIRIDKGRDLWGIEDDSGQLWQPVNMPEQLKRHEQKVRCVAQENTVESESDWGAPFISLLFKPREHKGVWSVCRYFYKKLHQSVCSSERALNNARTPLATTNY